MRIFAREIIGVLLLAAVIFLVLRLVVGGFTVIGDSMAPSLNAGEHVLINKLAFKYSDPVRGEIVYYRAPDGNADQLQRIIGLPGDIVEVNGSIVYINKLPLKEPYVKSSPRYTMPPYQVPAGNYFILGDNRNYSEDSSIGWTVPRDDILGRAWIYTWPPDKWGGIDNVPLDSQLAVAESP